MKLSLVPKPFGTSDKTMKKLYAFLYLAVREEKWHHVEWGFETLKLLYAKGYAQEQDVGRLGALVRSVDEIGATDCALRLMDGLVILYRQGMCEEIIGALTVIALHAYRNRKSSLLAKCGDYLCRIAMEEESIGESMLTSLRQIGILAIKRQEDGLFREIMSRTLTVCYLRKVKSDKQVGMLVVWLEKILERDGQACYEAWRDTFTDMVEQGRWQEKHLLSFMESCRPLAGMSAMNPYAPLLRRFLSDMLDYAELSKNIEVKITAVQIVGMAMRIAVQDHAPERAMPYVAVLVTYGGNWAWRQVAYPKLYETGEGRVLTAIWQVFLLLEQELQESTWGETSDKLLPLYEDYRNAFPTQERERLWWRALFAYRLKTNGTPIPSTVKKLTKKERIALIRQ